MPALLNNIFVGVIHFFGYLFLLFFFIMTSNKLSAQKKNNNAAGFISNVYDTVTYTVIIASPRMDQYEAKQLFTLRDSILSYIRINLKGVKVYIRKRPARIRNDKRLKCLIWVGDFKCYYDAISLKEKLVSDGYTESFIHGFQCDAEVLTNESLRKITAIRCNEMEQLNNEIYGDEYPWDSIGFNVMMGDYRDSVPVSLLSFVSEKLNNYAVNIKKSAEEIYQISFGDTVYFHGFSCYRDAVPLLTKIISAGYEDAYISAYNCFSEIDVGDAKKIKENKCR